MSIPEPVVNYRYQYVGGLVHELNDQQSAMLVTGDARIQRSTRAMG